MCFWVKINKLTRLLVNIENLTYKQEVGGSTPPAPTIVMKGFAENGKPFFIERLPRTCNSVQII